MYTPSLKWITLSLSLMVAASQGALIQSQGKPISQLAKSASPKAIGLSPTNCKKLTELAKKFQISMANAPSIDNQPKAWAFDWCQLNDDQKSQKFPLLWCAPWKLDEALAYVKGIQWLWGSKGINLVDF
ncbi:hypothetical protein BJ085DRAFT_29546 [Dimargaris cristalligena]|uniref:Uncharacterized protein n=1 Tax=Dimargaris cristalligena TaxID=215637 RepID=A0A4Q0A1G2_9FUNG|nr:hypothetical protein BJ085DRAFT_29546 [Dimargaris cristalligena]|eukprot:RKP39874.1 hypothetical protein BJ085DRAFT_29546 [Dimargaris cristalligena]